MSTTTAPASSQNGLSKMAAHWPPVVFIAFGVVLLGFWFAGTAIQVQTTEAWLMGGPVSRIPTFATFGQIILFIQGTLPEYLVVPFACGWGVQIALTVASIGIELPKHPKWRYYASWAVIVILIGVNSAGDYTFSSPYGGWGQTLFTVVILFMTFCMGLLAVVCFMHAFHKMNGGA